jgi:hypothetical protein
MILKIALRDHAASFQPRLRRAKFTSVVPDDLYEAASGLQICSDATPFEHMTSADLSDCLGEQSTGEGLVSDAQDPPYVVRGHFLPPLVGRRFRIPKYLIVSLASG